LQNARRPHFEGIVFCGISGRDLSLPQRVFQPEGRSGGKALPFVFNAVPKQCCTFQLNAIPTAGFSDPIFSYFSAAQFTFDGIRMLKEGYEKVICLSLIDPFSIELTMLLHLDKTGSIQDSQLSQMDSTGYRTSTNR
jgi:hypothetical protein